MHRRLGPERRPRKLAATIGDHLVDVHVELGAAARHPDMQWEHVVMLPGEDFIANLHDQLVTLIVQPLASVVRGGSGFLQGGIGGDHFAWNEVSADAEMLERALGLSAPQLVRRVLQPPRGCLVLLACRPWDFSTPFNHNSPVWDVPCRPSRLVRPSRLPMQQFCTSPVSWNAAGISRQARANTAFRCR